MKLIKVPLKIKKEARKMFEAGYDMIDVASYLNLNLGTLYNLSSKEGWIKGSSEDLLRVIEHEEDLRAVAEARAEVIKEYRTISNGIREAQVYLDRRVQVTEGNVLTAQPVLRKSEAEAVEKRANAMAKTYAVDKELYNIMTPREEIELARERAKYEELKRKLQRENETEEDMVI